MKYAVFAAAVLALVFTFSAASARMMSCTGDLSIMTVMMAGMPDGPHKSEMNKHLAMLMRRWPGMAPADAAWR